MPSINQRTVLSFVGFTSVLCLAIIFRPQATQKTQSAVWEDEYRYVIGIELGRTYSRVGVFRNETFQIIADDQSRKAIPSYVAFTDRGPPLVGLEAMKQADRNPKNTIYDARCLIGRRFSDPKLQDYIRDLPYDVKEKNGNLCIKVDIKRAETCLYPQEISSMVVAKLKNMAEAYLNTSLKHAVVAVPFHFDDEQRQMTKDAFTLAGLETIRVMNESTAIDIAYGMDHVYQSSGYWEESYFVVYDLGSKESNVAVESVDYSVFETLEQARDESLGRDAFDNSLLSYVINQVKGKPTFDLTKDLETMTIIKSEIGKAQRALLAESSTKVEIPTHGNFKGTSMTITRTQLQDMNKQLSDRALELVKRVLKDAKVAKKEVSAIIFSGNPEQLAIIQPSLEAYLDSRKPLSLKRINPDEAVVRGAAIQGYAYSSDNDDGVMVHYIPDQIPLSLGIETSKGDFTRMILRDDVSPTWKTGLFTTIRDNQEKAVIRIFEGEREVAGKNRLLGTLVLAGLDPKPRNVPSIEVVFELDANMVLKVMMRDQGSGKEASLSLSTSIGQYHEHDLDEIVSGAKVHYEEDQLFLKKYLADRSDESEEHEFGLVVKEGKGEV